MVDLAVNPMNCALAYRRIGGGVELPPGASALWDFENQQYSRPFNVERFSNGPLFEADGSYAVVPAHQPRITHDPFVGGNPTLYYETVAEDYYWVNSVFAGASEGTVGVNASLPSGWEAVNLLGGSIVIEEVGVYKGVPFLEYVIDVTNGTGGENYPGIKIASIPTSHGDSWIAACWIGYEVLAGDNETLPMRWDISVLNPPGQGAVSDWHNITNGGLSLRQYKGFQVGSPTAETLWLSLLGPLLPGRRIHRRIRVTFPTLTRGSVLSSPLASSDLHALRHRAAETLTLSLPAGSHNLTITFDNNSTQVIPNVSGEYVVASVNRPRIKRIISEGV